MLVALGEMPLTQLLLFEARLRKIIKAKDQLRKINWLNPDA